MLTANLTPLLESLREARSRTLALVDDLNDEQMIGPRLDIVNPLRWEIGHVAWFQEYWLLRHLLGRSPTLSTGDSLFDSARIAHDTRWDLPLLSKAETIAYAGKILNRVFEEYQRDYADSSPGAQDAVYFLSLTLFHEDMHAEAIAYTRQTLGYAAPEFTQALTHETPGENIDGTPGDAFIPGGTFLLGSANDQRFVFDNERDAHEVQLGPFAISRTAVTNAEFAAFVDDNGYQRRELWSEAGWRWRESNRAERPVYWERDGSKWWRRTFDQVVSLEDSLPVVHVNWYEAEAFCRWAHRRLPTEAEWEFAAAADPTTGDSPKRIFPWGNEPPTPRRSNLDWQNMGPVDVRLLAEGDSALGCRQMIGNVWEWTASDFLPYPGFVAGPYQEYSAPWFGDHKVLRGGCWATRSRLIHNAYRNFYKPDRRDVWAGFRTCAL